MDSLSPDEQAAFLDIYSGEDGELPVPPDAIKSLARRGLIKQHPDGAIGTTDRGTELYERMRGDEPYEGV